MPGFNQRGPRNEGPMTGGGRGICGRNQNAGQQTAGYGAGFGAGRGRGRGACRWGAGQGMGYGRGADAAPGRTDSLQDRVEMLEAELAAARAQLKNQS